MRGVASDYVVTLNSLHMWWLIVKGEIRASNENTQAIELSGNCEALQLEGRRASCQWTIVLGFHYEAHVHQPTNASVPQPHLDLVTKISSQERTDGHSWRLLEIYRYFWPYFHCVCAETAIFKLPVKILASQLNSVVTQISYERAIIRRSDEVLRCLFSLHRWKVCQISISVP